MAQSFTLHSVRIENDPIFVEEQTQSTPTISFVQYSSIDEFAFPVSWNENNFLQTLWSIQVIMWWNYWHCGSKHNLSTIQSKIELVCPQFFWSGNCGGYRWVRGPRSCRFCANDQIIHNNTQYTIHNTHHTIHNVQNTTKSIHNTQCITMHILQVVKSQSHDNTQCTMSNTQHC